MSGKTKITRSSFEQLSSTKQRNYAARHYDPKSFIRELNFDGIYRDETGNILTEVHHCWERSHCPVWYYFQPENYLAVSNQAHYYLHNVDRDKWPESVRKISDRAELIKARMIQDDKDYNQKAE